MTESHLQFETFMKVEATEPVVSSFVRRLPRKHSHVGVS